jgi:hypothetical protein
MKKRPLRWGLSVAVALVGLLSCSSRPPAPNKVVIEFLEKDLPNSDTTAILAKLDLPTLVQERKSEFAESGDSIRAQRYTEDSLIADLTTGGELNDRWLALQIIVSRVIEKENTAYVEVSFIDAKRDVQYYNRMGLRKTKEGWKIYSFKTL